MRSVLTAPRSFVDPRTGRPAFGSYAGPLPAVKVGAGVIDRVVRRKRWLWMGIASRELWCSLAVVRTGYAASAFAVVFDRARQELLVDRNLVAGPGAGEVGDDPHASGTLARFAARRAEIVVDRRREIEVRAHFDDFELEARVDGETGSAISAIASLGERLASGTEKHVLMSTTGHVRCGGRRFELDGALSGYDYSQGLMPRRTRWNWAFAIGHASDHRPIGFNLVEGFVGEAECAAFRDRMTPLSEPHFERSAGGFRVAGEGIDLSFVALAEHAQRTNLVVVRSRFLQSLGTFRGSIRIDGEDVVLEDMPGVVEDQDVVW